MLQQLNIVLNFNFTPRIYWFDSAWVYLNQKYYKLKKGVNYMEKNMIKISLSEYEGMKETIEILQNPDIMCQILESEDNIKKGKVKEFEC